MPIYIGTSQNRRKIRIKSLSKPQYFAGANCIPGQIFLQATLNDITNLRNHAFEWAHVDGEGETPSDLAPVAGQSPVPETRASFSPPLDEEDQVFQFFIDRGTNKELSDFTKIYYTPTSLTSDLVSQNKYSETSSTIPNLAKEPAVFPGPSGIFEDRVDVQGGVKLSFDRTALSKLAGNQERLEVLYSSTGGTDPQEIFATYLAVNWPNNITVPNGAYRIRVYYQIDNKRLVSYTSPVFAATSTFEGDIFASHDFYSVGSGIGKLLSFRRIAPQTINESTIFGSLLATPVKAANVKRFGQQLINENIKPENLDSFSLMLVSASGLTNLFRSNVQGIGGN